MNKPRFSAHFRESCLIVGEHCYGLKGTWAYEIYSFINDTYFAGRLPWPHILWGLTAHGSCMAWASMARDKSRPPIITLHPSMLRSTEKEDPWGIPRDWLGPSLVFDALFHECIHVHIEYNLGGHIGRTSHDCKRWVRQVNRLAPLLGFNDIQVGVTKTVRVPDRSAPRTIRGKLATKVVRRCEGNVPFAVGTGFPESFRRYTGTANGHYRSNQLPAGAPPLLIGRKK
jgi:hypothetical protein